MRYLLLPFSLTCQASLSYPRRLPVTCHTDTGEKTKQDFTVTDGSIATDMKFTLWTQADIHMATLLVGNFYTFEDVAYNMPYDDGGIGSIKSISSTSIVPLDPSNSKVQAIQTRIDVRHTAGENLKRVPDLQTLYTLH